MREGKGDHVDAVGLALHGHPGEFRLNLAKVVGLNDVLHPLPIDRVGAELQIVARRDLTDKLRKERGVVSRRVGSEGMGGYG